MATVTTGNMIRAQADPISGYFTNIKDIRHREYPGLSSTTYLDHSGTTLYARSLIERYTVDLTNNLFGNPHSGSASSQLSSKRIDDVRLKVLTFFHASPVDFDVVFVANATAAIKLVGEAFRDLEQGFWYGYHSDCHTSMVGVRELATLGSRCFDDDQGVEQWLENRQQSTVPNDHVELFGFSGQSNMTGSRAPLGWCSRVRQKLRGAGQNVYTLLDAAALVSTSPLDLSDTNQAPDFIALSFYKIFGFPDLGALIVRKSSADILRKRRYFAGGTVDIVTNGSDQWHAKKQPIHDSLEEGTVPFHNIVALGLAIEVHTRLYGSMLNISKHCDYLARKARSYLIDLRHSNGKAVCKVYGAQNPAQQGPVIAFNLLDSSGKWVSNTEIEKLSIVNNIQLRTGGLCNPGGIASNLGLSPEEMKQNYSAGYRCGGEIDVRNGKPTGAVRISFGAMSSVHDVDAFIAFVESFYVDRNAPARMSTNHLDTPSLQSQFIVESMSIFPIKSCAAFKVPLDVHWEIGPRGLAWDREWCLLHEGTSVALSQKRYPRMALLQPRIDVARRELIVSHSIDELPMTTISISLDQFPRTCEQYTNRESSICGESLDVQIYTSTSINSFFSNALGTPCALARYPRGGPARYAKIRRPRSSINAASPTKAANAADRSIMLSNESPILLISRSSVNRLNEQIKENGGAGKAIKADSFRGNIVVSEELMPGQKESPYVEEEWTSLRMASGTFEVLGPCQRCQMVCVDQKSAKRRQEPYSTLAKTRRRDGRVWFGMHLSLATDADAPCYLQIGDRVWPT